MTVIGSGPGGYVAAIKAAQLGFKVRVKRRPGADFYTHKVLCKWRCGKWFLNSVKCL